MLAASLLFTGCAQFNPQFDFDTGCILQKVELSGERFQGGRAFVGYCPQQEVFVGIWQQEVEDFSGDVSDTLWFQIEVDKKGRFVVRYRVGKLWVEWSEKSGIIFVIPEEFGPENIEETSQK